MSFVVLQAVFVVQVVIILAAVGGLMYAIHTDATQRDVPGSYPTFWAIGATVIPFIIVPLYVYYAPRLGERSEPRTAAEWWSIWLAGTATTTLVAAALLSPPDPFTNLIVWATLFVPVGVVFYLLVFTVPLPLQHGMG
jgi:hypothetical protein